MLMEGGIRGESYRTERVWKELLDSRKELWQWRACTVQTTFVNASHKTSVHCSRRLLLAKAHRLLHRYCQLLLQRFHILIRRQIDPVEAGHG